MQNKFSKRHYEAIAKVIFDHRKNEVVANDADTLITKLMTMFYEDNINFNVRTFNTAIGSPLWNNDHFEKSVKNKEI